MGRDLPAASLVTETSAGLTKLNLHPKVAAMGSAASVAALLVYLVGLTGHTLPTGPATGIVTLVGVLAGYRAPNTV